MKMPFSHDYGKETSLANVSTSVLANIKKWMPEKRILAIVAVLIALIVSAPFLFNTVYKLLYPVASITDVNVGYTQFSDYGLYTANFRLMNSIHKWAASDGTVNIKITQNNVTLYEKTFTVYESQFKEGGGWLWGSIYYYRSTIPSSEVPVQGIPYVSPHLASDSPKNVTATITFTTPQGRTLTGTDDMWELP